MGPATCHDALSTISMTVKHFIHLTFDAKKMYLEVNTMVLKIIIHKLSLNHMRLFSLRSAIVNVVTLIANERS